MSCYTTLLFSARALIARCCFVLRRGALLLQLLDSYAVRYSEMLDGRSEHLPVNELAGGARIRHIFLDIFVNGLQELNPSRHAS